MIAYSNFFDTEVTKINNKSIHFIGGEGNDILNLPNVTADVWEVISSMFTGFETIYLSDATINN
jgi:hypothetical protein